jgi:hypothetical protein
MYNGTGKTAVTAHQMAMKTTKVISPLTPRGS